MKKPKYLNIISFSIIAIFFLIGCKSKNTVTTGGELSKKTHQEVIHDTKSKEIAFNTISAKGNIELIAGNSSKKTSAVFKIIKDSVLQVSVRPVFGMEALRMDITPSGITIIDRFKKQYFTENFNDSDYLKQMDFNFYNLQALFTNQLFIPGQTSVDYNDYKKFNINVANNLYMLQTKGKGGVLYNFAIDASDHIVSTLILNEKQNLSIQWSYMDFIEDNKFIYPTNMLAKLEFGKHKADIGISYNKLEINDNFNIDTTIPSKYPKVGFKELIGSYIKLK